jgi:hypothetical protein
MDILHILSPYLALTFSAQNPDVKGDDTLTVLELEASRSSSVRMFLSQ